MVPKWNQSEEMWQFSRSKLLTKTADAIEAVSGWQEKTDREQQQREVFAQLIGDEFDYLQERGEIKLVAASDNRGRSIKKIVRIELPNVHIDLYSPDNGSSFRLESIRPMENVNTNRYFSIDSVKKIITRLEDLFRSEEDLGTERGRR